MPKTFLKSYEKLMPCQSCGAVLIVDLLQDLTNIKENLMYPERQYVLEDSFVEVFKCTECGEHTEYRRASEVIIRDGVDNLNLKIKIG